jgi:hypothetical protein
MSFFLNAFAPCYGPNDSRYTHGVNGTFYFLQPETSFHYRMQRSRVKQIKNAIQNTFSRKGQSYPAELNEADKFVLPPKDSKPEPAWYTYLAPQFWPWF